MVEILWKSKAPHSPVQDHELVELRLVHPGRSSSRNYLVREIHAEWSAAAQQIEWRGFTDQAFESRLAAEDSYLTRKASIMESGFPYTTVLG